MAAPAAVLQSVFASPSPPPPFFFQIYTLNGYKDSKYSRLVRMARRLGHDVQRTKTTYTFDPMPADERRAIHNALNNMPNVRTESIGEGAQRQVQIIYVE